MPQLSPLKRLSSEFAYLRNHKKHFSKLPLLPLSDQKIAEDLRRDGICVTSLESLALPLTSKLNNAANQLFPMLGEIEHRNGFFVTANNAQKLHYPEFFLWGIQDRILNIVENYIGLPVSYLGAGILCSLPNGKSVRSRKWHRDMEDRRHVKVMIYFNEIDSESGPFEFIPKSVAPLSLYLNYSFSPELFISDEKMESFVPKSKWKSCTGPAGTVVFFEPNNFHRGRMPIASTRRSVIYKYVSRQPKSPTYCLPNFSVDEVQAVDAMLSQRQRECIYAL